MIAARSHVYAVQRAAADVTLEGSAVVRTTCREAAQALELYFAELRTFASHLADADVHRSHSNNRRCAAQRVRVRRSLDAFAAAARRDLDGGDDVPENAVRVSAADIAQQDRVWLKTQVAELLECHRADIDEELSLLAVGLDSLSLIELALKIKTGYGPDLHQTWGWSDLSLAQVSQELTRRRSRRASGRRLTRVPTDRSMANERSAAEQNPTADEA